jgi:DNA polymerase-4
MIISCGKRIRILNSRIILHIDMDAFYAAIEQRDQPEFRGKPVVVGADPHHGRGRGVVSTASYEARKFGIHSAQPISEAWRKCPHAIFLPVRMSRYVAVSRQIMDILSYYSPLIEKISLDEAFLDLSGTERLLGDYIVTGKKIKAHIRDMTGLSASVGIGPNKLIAKIASDHDKPDGFIVVDPDHFSEFLYPLSIRRLWGIGKQTEKRLHDIGVHTISDLSKLSLDFLMHEYGKWGRCLYYYAQGIDESPVVPYRDAKSVSHEITFPKDETSTEIMRQTLLQLSEKVGYRLRLQELMAKTVSLKVRFADFTTLIRSSTLPNPFFLGESIYHEVYHLFETIDLAERSIRLLGVAVSQLISSHAMQTDLFSSSSDEKLNKATEAIDQLRNRFGDDVIHRGL